MKSQAEFALFQYIAHAIPDIFIFASILIMFALKIFLNEDSLRKVYSRFSIVISSICAILTSVHSSINDTFVTSSFVYDKFSYTAKLILFIYSALTFLSINLTKTYKETPSILYMMIFGVIFAISVCLSSNNFLILFIGLEIYTFSVCFFLLLNKYNIKAHANSLRFLITSTIIGTIFLFGLSVYYSVFQNLSFENIIKTDDAILNITTLLLFSYLLFKMSAAPFHSWAIDIYENAALQVVVFFEVIWKIFAIIIFSKVFIVFMLKGLLEDRTFLSISAIFSMIIGGIAPIRQQNIKKFIAYASVGHVGFVLSVFAVIKSQFSVRFAITYVFSYIISAICFFTIIIYIKQHRKILNFKDLSGIAHESPILGYGIVLSMLAMIGTPPFINFIAKVNVLRVLITRENWLLTCVACCYSVLCLIYTIKILRILFRTQYEKERIKIKNSALVVSLTILLSGGALLHPIIDTFFKNIIDNVYVGEVLEAKDQD